MKGNRVYTGRLSIILPLGLAAAFACSTSFGKTASARKAAADSCPNGVLPAGGVGIDLEITTFCVVDGKVPNGSYTYHNVNIYGGGTLKFNDAVIDFYAESILVESGGSLTAGASPDPPIGANGGVVTIHLYGAQGDPGIVCKTDAMCGVPEAIWESNKIDMSVMSPTTCNSSSSLPGGVTTASTNTAFSITAT
jgi:hypothetical protein